MAKIKHLDGWGRHKARERYADGGEVKPSEVMVNPSGSHVWPGSSVFTDALDKMEARDSGPSNGGLSPSESAARMRGSRK